MIGCAGSVRYYFDEPQHQDINIEGLEQKDIIVEVSDSYKNIYTDGSEFWIVINSDTTYKIGKLDFQTGKISDLKPLQNYNEDENSIYWTYISEDSPGLLTKIANILGPSSDKWYEFLGKKYIWGNTNNIVDAKYFWRQSKDVTFKGQWQILSESENTAYKIVFIDDDKECEVLEYYGHKFGDLKEEYTGKKCRFYKIDSISYLGFMPENMPTSTTTKYFYYIVNYKNRKGISYGAMMPESELEYVDAIVDKEGKNVGIIFKKNKVYILRKYSVNDFINKIKSYRKD
ncbi:MAG: hypothetical protein N2490_02150 [Ignavibacteria bacterium]|nr:hypothetical protein [Ignavibacteria bacterium]